MTYSCRPSTGRAASLPGDALTWDALTWDALTWDALTWDALTGGALTGGALTGATTGALALAQPTLRPASTSKA